VNGYANSWVVDASTVCESPESCSKGVDGSDEIELVLEYWPQRLFYILFATELFIGISFFFYLIVRFVRTRLRNQ